MQRDSNNGYISPSSSIGGGRFSPLNSPPRYDEQSDARPATAAVVSPARRKSYNQDQPEEVLRAGSSKKLNNLLSFLDEISTTSAADANDGLSTLSYSPTSHHSRARYTENHGNKNSFLFSSFIVWNECVNIL